jgi:hypothetical protein
MVHVGVDMVLPQDSCMSVNRCRQNTVTLLDSSTAFRAVALLSLQRRRAFRLPPAFKHSHTPLIQQGCSKITISAFTSNYSSRPSNMPCIVVAC